MRTLLVLAMLFAGLSAAAVPNSKGENARQARAHWIANKSDFFRGRGAVDADLAERRFRADTNPAPGNYMAAFKLAHDDRLAFASVNLKGGKFVRGRLLRFGLPDANLSSRDWDELRRTHAMAIALAYDQAPVCLFPPTTRAHTFKAPFCRGLWGVHNPPEYLFGGMEHAVGQLGARYWGATYDVWVDLPGADGGVIKLGTLGPGQYMNADALTDAMRRELKRNASDRAMLDLYYKGMVEYRAQGAKSGDYKLVTPAENQQGKGKKGNRK